MKKISLFVAIILLVSAGCSRHDNLPEGPDAPEQGTTYLKDPGLLWSADSFVATLGAENSFPTLSNPNNLSISYESSQPDVAEIDENGAITLVSAGTTMIKATSPADETYFSSGDSYLLTVLGQSSGDDGDPLTFASTGDPASDDDISNSSFKSCISITFSETADAAVEGDSYGYVSVDGNKVTVNNTGGEVLVYELSGTTSNGYFKIYGAKKQAIVLNGANITNPDGAALNNQNKKRTFIVVEGVNTLSDGPSASYPQVSEEDLKSVLFSEAQIIFSGSGLLNVNALNAVGKSGISSDDYIRVLNSPTIKVTTGTGAGHGFKGKDYVQLSAGSLIVSTAAALKKGITSDEHVIVEGGTHMVTVTGGVAYDEEDGEYSGTAGVKCDNYFAMTGGSLTIKNTGNGGKGINAGSYDYDAENHTLADSYISGGELTITTSGREANDVSAKGMKIGWVTKSSANGHETVTGNAGNLIISGGKINISSSYGEGLEVKGALTFEGGETYVYSTGDDAINSQGDFTVNNGFIHSFSSQNDALDSNGDLILNGGYVMAVCTKGTPELGLDANTEGGKKLYINNGATIVAYGGLERGYSAQQSIYTFNAAAGAWNALYGSSFIAAFKAPSNVSTYIVSAPGLTKGYKSVSVSGEPVCNGIWATSGISGGTAVTLSAYSGYSGGGPGGGPGGRP